MPSSTLELLGPAVALIVGMAVAGWGLSCRAGRFPRNPILGYRTRAALSSKDAWVAAHRGYAPLLITGGVLLTAAALIAVAAVLAGEVGVVGPAITAGIIALLVAVIIGAFFAHRALRLYLAQTG